MSLRLPQVPRWEGLPLVAGFAVLAFAVLAFAGGWRGGEAVLDGPGTSLYVRLALHYLDKMGRVPYWLPEMWAGTPAWALAPSFPVFVLVPLARLTSPEGALKIALLSFQIVGTWGAFVLARSLWHRTGPALVAGVIYGLHPFFMSHGPFAGAETSVGVMAVTPWMVLVLRRALRGEGPQYVVFSGLLAAFAVLQQAEHAYGLALLCCFLLAVELAKVRLTGSGATGPAGMLFRASVVVLICVGTVAFWLAPFLSSAKWFTLTPPEIVRYELEEGTGARVGKDLGIFLDRSEGIVGTVAFDRTDLAKTGAFYLGAVCVGLTLLTICLLPRHDPDGTLTAVLVASAVGVWMSTGAVSLASGNLAKKGHIITFIVIGAVSGVLIGSLLREFGAGRLALVAGVSSAILLMVVPYLTPFLTLQRVIPFLESIRFPRFYTLAPLGLALGSGYPLVLAGNWAAARQAHLAPLLTAAVTVAVIGVFLVDVHPYRSFYRLQLPDSTEALATVTRTLDDYGGTTRIATGSFGDPRAIEVLLGTGQRTSVGWPHPLSAKRTWRLTIESLVAPLQFRDSALGLSGTGYLSGERIVSSGHLRLVDGVQLEPNPSALPLVRAYDRAVVVSDDALTPELAVSLAPRGVSVVTGGRSARDRLGGVTMGSIDGPDACHGKPSGEWATEVATACAVSRWIGVLGGTKLLSTEEPVGAVFQSPLANLQGVAVWLNDRPEHTELGLWELAPDGRSLGREVARVQASGYDDKGMAAFRFDPIPDSEGARYVFMLTCPDCEEKDVEERRLITVPDDRGPSNVVVNGKRQRGRVAAFTPIYERPRVAEPSSTTVQATAVGPGRWRIHSSGSRPALVVVAESWFPGWKAKVDGKSTPVLVADSAFLGVPVGPGEHDVVLEYHKPGAVWVGRAVTAATLALCVLILLASRRPRRPLRARPLSPANTSPNGQRSPDRGLAQGISSRRAPPG